MSVFGIDLLPGLNSVAALVLVGLGVALVRHRVLWGLWVAVTIVMMVLVVQVDRYLLPILPLLVYGVVAGDLVAQPAATSALGELDLWSFVGGGGGAQCNEDRLHRLRAASAGHSWPAIRTDDIRRCSRWPSTLGSRSASRRSCWRLTRHRRVLTYITRREVIEAGEGNASLAGRDVYLVWDSQDKAQKAWLSKLSVRPGAAVAPLVHRRGGSGPLILCRALLPQPRITFHDSFGRLIGSMSRLFGLLCGSVGLRFLPLNSRVRRISLTQSQRIRRRVLRMLLHAQQ